MIKQNTRLIAVFLLLVISFNLMMFVFPVTVRASFFEEHKDSIFNVVKGALMLWLLNMFLSDGEEPEDTGQETFPAVVEINGQEDGSDEPDPNSDPEIEIVPIEEGNSEAILTDKEKELFSLVNSLREREGLPSLNVNSELLETARMKARDMIENEYFEHYSPVYGSPFDMIQERNINYLLAGENLAGASTAKEAFQLLMESEDHAENILEERYNEAGFGIIEGGPYGLMVVQHFIRAE